jgi:hypothetical protein
MLTESRVREIFRESAALTAGFPLMRISYAMAGLTPPEIVPMTDEEFEARSERVRTTMAAERDRILSIIQLIALLGLPEARRQAGPISTRAFAEWRMVQDQAWRYTKWDHRMLLAATHARESVTPILPEEVDAVANCLEEILPLNPQVYTGFGFMQKEGDALRADPESRTKPAAERPRDPEARKWLGRRTPSMLAGNRFGTRVAAVAFVEMLYASGASKVLIAGDSIDPDDGTGSAHADVLIVKLPKDPTIRARLFEIVNAELRREGLDEERDDGQKEARMWWD